MHPPRIRLNRIVIVEGKYDKIKLSSCLEGTILVTNGFQIFKNPQKRTLIRKLGQQHGLLLLTDSDIAGMQIRHYISSIAKGCDIKHIYIPQIIGKERRKQTPSKAGTLGVEGMDIQLLYQLFQQHGILSSTQSPLSTPSTQKVTKQHLFEDGYIGSSGSRMKRLALLQHLELPDHLNTNMLLQMINSLMTAQDYCNFTHQLNDHPPSP